MSAKALPLALRRLKHLPRLGQLTDEIGVHVIIEPQYQYRVFYVLDGQRVIVLRVLHPSQP